MAKFIEVPTNQIKGHEWLNITSVLGKRVLICAHSINDPYRGKAPDGHESYFCRAKSGVICKSEEFEIKIKIKDVFQKPKKK